MQKWKLQFLRNALFLPFPPVVSVYNNKKWIWNKYWKCHCHSDIVTFSCRKLMTDTPPLIWYPHHLDCSLHALPIIWVIMFSFSTYSSSPCLYLSSILSNEYMDRHNLITSWTQWAYAGPFSRGGAEEWKHFVSFVCIMQDSIVSHVLVCVLYVALYIHM